MTKKGKTKKSEISVIEGRKEYDNPVFSLYRLIAMCGAAESSKDIRTRYSDEGGNVSIAIPKIKFAIIFPGDDFAPLKEKGWRMHQVNKSELEVFSRVFFGIVDEMKIAYIYAKSDPTVKSTSKEEERIYQEIIRRSLPTPDRNFKFKREDGTELTTPDFTWEEYKIAFFMDGAYWHSVKDDKEVIKVIKRSRKIQDSIVDKRKDKVWKDQDIRSEIASMGWIVLGCTDKDVSDDEGVQRIVNRIEKAIKNVAMSREVKKELVDEDNSSDQNEKKSSVIDLLSE